MERDELAAWLRLALTPRIGNQAARRLLAAFGLPHQIFQQDQATLADAAGAAAARSLQDPPDGFEAQLQRTLDWLAEDPLRRDIVSLADTAYPQDLLNIEDPPVMLYRMGRLDAPASPAVAMVGSRNPTPQGLQNARQFARALAEAQVTIVSGLALGIDGAAHQGAIDGAPTERLATIAVVGTGLDRVYPRRHHALARSIAERGLLVSEYPLGTPPLAENFPRRNRIIAGLSQGTLVVEAALQSGSLITARLASEQGKEVFAIPGSIHSPQARGCHALLRQGAKLVESAQDVLEDLRLAPARPREVPTTEGDESAHHPLLEAMGFEPVTLDALIARSGVPAAALQAALLELELAGEVARLPGGQFQRVAAG